MSSPRVIVIEDSATLAALAIRGLRMAGVANADFATTGADALALINANKPDLVLLDLRLPDMEGWQILDELFARYGKRATKVIIMTTYDNDEAREKAAAYGVERYVLKPVMPNELVEMVTTMLALPSAK